MQGATTGDENQASKGKEIEFLNLQKGVEGITSLLDKPIETIEEGIVNVDQSIQSILNTMGQGKNLAEGLKKEYAQAALNVISMGGTQKDALAIQQETLETLGRNVVLSKEQTTDIFAASKFSGVVTKDLIAGFTNAGMSLKDISAEMLKVREVSNNLGVNAKAVSSLVVANLDKLNRFNFQGGVEGLAKMAAQSQTLRVGMEETMDFADGLMDPEKAIEMSATFQRLGVASEKLLNPLKLMDMAQNDVAGLQKEIAGAVAQYTTFNKETGKSQISPQGIRILKEISKETGFARGELEKMALAEREIGEKLSVIDFSGFNIDDETKSLIANVATMGKGGEYVVKTKQVDKEGKETIVEKSIQDLLVQTKGNADELRNALVGEEEKPTDPIELAKDQLDVLSKINAGIAELKATPGMMVGASKLGKATLDANLSLSEGINEPLKDIFAIGGELNKELDGTAVKFQDLVTILKDPTLSGADRQKAFTDLIKQGEELVTSLLGATVEATGTATKNVLGEDQYNNIMSGVQEKLESLEGKDAEIIGILKDKLGLPKDKEKAEILDEIGKIEQERQDSFNFQDTKGINIDETKGQKEILEEIKKIEEEHSLHSETLNGTLDNLDKSLTDGVNTKSITTESLSVTTDKPINLVAPEKTEEITTTPVTTPTTIQAINPEIQKLIDEGIVGPPTASLGTETYLPTTTPLPVINETIGTEIQPIPETTAELSKIDTSEVDTLNVKNLNIGTALDELVGKISATPENAEKTNLIISELEKQVESVKEGAIQPTAAITEKPTTTPSINIAEPQPITEEELPSIEEGLPPIETKQPTGLFEKISQKASSLIEGPKPEPSVSENYKKLLEEINNAEVVGRGEESFFLTPEMTAQAKKDSEFIGPEKGIPKKIESTRSITTLTKEELAEIEKELEIESYDKKYNEINNEIKNFKKEKIGIGGVEREEDMGKDDLDTLESMRKRRDTYEEMSYDLDIGEVESFNKKIETKGVEKEMELAPIKPTLSQIPIPEKEEKQPLGKRLKEGIGNLTEKLKKEKVKEPTVTAAIPETQEEFIVRDTQGNELARSIDRETAERKAGTSEGITVSKETTPITPSVPETPAVGIEKIAAENKEEKIPLKERLKNLIKEKPAESEGKITIEEPVETKTITPEDNLKIELEQQEKTDKENQRKMIREVQSGGKIQETPKIEPIVPEPKEESGYLKMLAENDSEADKFLTSKSGLPVNLDKIEPKEIEESGPLGVSLTSMEEEEGGIVEPVTITPEEPKETEIQTALREAREKQLSYLEELRQKEQIETPSRGIEKIAEIGGRIGEFGKGLFGKPEVQEEIQQYEMPEETEYEYTPIDEMGKFDISNLKQEYLGPEEIEAPEAPEIGIPEIPTPQGINEQVFGGQTAQTGVEGSTQTINVNAKIEITGNPAFANLLDPRKLQSTVESIFVTSMSQKTNVAQKVNASSQDASMGISSYSSSLDQ
jgi:hypothetical protein